jgi:L-asparaginase
MRGERARPTLDGLALVAAVPALAGLADLEVQTLRALPGVQVGLDDALAVARAARAAARSGRGAVVTAGTDTLEELAVLCDLIADAAPPIVLTGAIRPASSAGADGPANLVDAVAVASSEAAGDLGAVVVFGGQVHAARWVRKLDASGPVAFGSPQGGPIGWAGEGRAAILARPEPRPALDPARLDLRVPIVPAALGDDGSLVRAALETGPDGLVAVALGAGHGPPAWLDAVREAAKRVPVALAVRPERGTILRETYGFAGSERDLRASGALPAGLLSPAAARVTLLACLGAGLDRDAIRAVLARDDP